MRRFLGTLLLFILPAPIPASDFDWLVREFSRESGAQQVHVPFLGFANFVVKIARPAGTSEFKLAVFERPGMGCRQFNAITDSTVGSSWKPMIRVRSSRGDSTNIYGRNNGKNLSILIATLNDDDATFVQVRIKPEVLMRFIDEHDLRH